MRNLLARIMRSTSGTEANAWTILKLIAEHKSCLVRDVAAGVELSMEDTLAALSTLEHRAFARVSADKRDVHDRIVAITRRGRNEVTQAGVVNRNRRIQSDARLGA
jgi:DNA-binding MarR family transcriptional regulator